MGPKLKTEQETRTQLQKFESLGIIDFLCFQDSVYLLSPYSLPPSSAIIIYDITYQWQMFWALYKEAQIYLPNPTITIQGRYYLHFTNEETESLNHLSNATEQSKWKT